MRALTIVQIISLSEFPYPDHWEMSAIANKGDAIKCIQRAKECIVEKDLEKAKRLLQKSMRLYQTVEAQQLLARIEIGDFDQQSKENAKPKKPSEAAEQIKKRRDAKKAADAPSKPVPNDEAAQISRMKDYYEILQVSKTADGKTIKKAYRKLALKFHPDKNDSPSAEAAFKMINKSYECLSDEQSRAAYDRYGPDEERIRQSAPGSQRYSDMDLSSEDLFNLFFNGVPPQRGARSGFHFHSSASGFPSGFPFHQQRQQRRTEPQRSDSPFWHLLVNFLPILLMMLVSLLSSYSSASTSFSLHRTAEFKQHHTTSLGGFDYYVQPSFYRYYGQDASVMRDLEGQVIVETMNDLKQKCAEETRLRDEKIEKAKQSSSSIRPSRLKKAYGTRLFSCEKIKTFLNENT